MATTGNLFSPEFSFSSSAKKPLRLTIARLLLTVTVALLSVSPLMMALPLLLSTSPATVNVGPSVWRITRYAVDGSLKFPGKSS